MQKVIFGILLFSLAGLLIHPLYADAQSDTVIPSWVKSSAGWWASGDLDDDSFIQGIQFMIREGLMSIPATEQGVASPQGNSIPDWIRNNAG